MLNILVIIFKNDDKINTSFLKPDILSVFRFIFLVKKKLKNPFVSLPKKKK